jgi:glycosyltransferase involved in cell wall biosynthesis
MKRICVSVSNDLLCDNRVDKTCNSLTKCGLSVKLIGRKFKDSPSLTSRPYQCKRLGVCFKNNIVYYAELNIRLFFYLIFSKQDFLWANDLDTLLPNYLVAKIKHKPLIFDSHEHFTEVPELKNNPFAKKVWKSIEKHCIKGCDAVFTVCNPIKDYFKKEYSVECEILRNIPSKTYINEDITTSANKDNILVWQGAVNVERGLEELCEAMLYIDAQLIIMGDGDIKGVLKKRVKELNIENKVKFLGRLPFKEMIKNTKLSKLAISIDKPTNGNYSISLPNKIFEYISCSIPVLVSPLQEIKHIVDNYHTGIYIKSYEPKELAKQINEILSDNQTLDLISDNCRKAAKELSWENEEKKLFNTIKNII